VGRLVVSQVLTLYIIPVVYYYMDRIQGKTQHVAWQTQEKRKCLIL
jgi:hypothetical protein